MADRPDGSLTLSGSTLYGMTAAGGTIITARFSDQHERHRLSNLFSFSGTNGENSRGSLTPSGSPFMGRRRWRRQREGTVFSIDTDGSGFQSLISFTGPGGAYTGGNPGTELTLSGQRFSGLPRKADPCHSGRRTVFSVQTDGTGFKNLLSFNNTDAYLPFGGLRLSAQPFTGDKYWWRQRCGHYLQRQYGRHRLPKPALV